MVRVENARVKFGVWCVPARPTLPVVEISPVLTTFHNNDEQVEGEAELATGHESKNVRVKFGAPLRGPSHNNDEQVGREAELATRRDPQHLY
jgi:hypothetical protein